MDNNCSVYIHIPFCYKKCIYCDFNSYANYQNYYESYVNALIHEIKSSEELPRLNIKTIFIGGGTPSVLHSHYIGKIMQAFKYFNINSDAEITIEANPDSLSFEKLKAYKYYGINRLSLGLQAWQNSLLKILKRPHSKQDFLKCFENALKVGFSNINADIMFGIPNQSLSDWQETIDSLSRLDLTHISCYSLIIEENAPIYENYLNNELVLPDDETDRQMYYYALDRLNDRDFSQYEISNFAKPGYASKHNIAYWKRENYLGFGLSAHSMLNDVRFENIGDFQSYIKFAGNASYIRQNHRKLSEKEIMEEFMFLGLRMNEGVDSIKFQHAFAQNIMDIYGDVINKNINQNLLVCDSGIYKLTPKGIDLSNLILSDFLL